MQQKTQAFRFTSECAFVPWVENNFGSVASDGKYIFVGLSRGSKPQRFTWDQYPRNEEVLDDVYTRLAISSDKKTLYGYKPTPERTLNSFSLPNLDILSSTNLTTNGNMLIMRIDPSDGSPWFHCPMQLSLVSSSSEKIFHEDLAFAWTFEFLSDSIVTATYDLEFKLFDKKTKTKFRDLTISGVQKSDKLVDLFRVGTKNMLVCAFEDGSFAILNHAF